MLFFQNIPESLDPVATVAKDALERAWDVTPTSVYGLLLGILLVAIVYLVYRLTQKDKDLKQMHKDLLDMNLSNIDVLKDLDTSLLLLTEKGATIGENLKEHIEFTREHISKELSKIEDYVKNT